LDEFDDFMAKQENFNAYVGRQLKINTYMIGHLSDYMSRVKDELKLTEGHPKRIEQDSQRNKVDAPSPSKKKKKKND